MSQVAATQTDGRRVIVVGTGPTGAIAASTLIASGIPVLQLEAGGRMPPGALIRAFGINLFRLRPLLEASQPHFLPAGDRTAVWLQALMPGGMSHHWTGAVPRFSPEDFFEGQRLHERYRWPLDYADLAPYYDQVERLVGVTGPLTKSVGLPKGLYRYERSLPGAWRLVGKAALERGMGFQPIPLADGAGFMVRRWGTAFNSYADLIRPLLTNPHYALRPNSHVVRIEWDSERRAARSVLVRDVRGTVEELPCAAVVVAAGALNSTRILLNSDSPDFPAGLGNDHGLLGKYLHDHVKQWSEFEVDRYLPRLMHAAYLTRTPYAESDPLVGAACTVGNAAGSPLQRVLARTPFPTRHFGVSTFGTVIPHDTNYVALLPGKVDEYGVPLLMLNMQFNDGDRRNVGDAHSRLLSLLEDAGIHTRTLSMVIDPPGTSVHYGGTIRMHESPTHGMLNAWNRLHAVNNVAVVDASCFTTGPEKNPTLTALALATRAAVRLADDLRTGSIS